MTPAIRPAVVLSCAGAPDGDLNVVRALGREGVPVYLVAEYERPPAARSRYCQEFILVPCFRREPAAVVASLIKLAQRFDEKPVLFPTADPDLQLVTEWRSQLDAHFEIPIAPPSLIHAITNKFDFAQLAARHDLPVPESHSAAALGLGTDSIEVFASRLKFPVILKPIDTCNWSRPDIAKIVGSAKAIIALTKDDLVDACRPLLPVADDLLVQQYISGDDSNYYDFQAYIDRHGDMVAWFSGRKIRTIPPAVGAGCYVESTINTQLHDIGSACLRKIGFTGLVDMDFKYDPIGKRFLLIEINPRTAAWGILPTVAGINFPFIAYSDLTSQPIKQHTSQRENLRYLHIGNDLRAFREYRRRGEWRVDQYLSSLLGKKLVFQFFSGDDPMPFWYTVKASIRARATRLLGDPGPRQHTTASPRQWNIELIKSPEALASLEPEWRDLQNRSPGPSLFACYDYISIAWKHLHRPTDKPFILVLRDAGEIVAIAPFRQSRIMWRGIPARVIDWLATWEGDRPGILCAGNPDECWQQIEHYFAQENSGWDLLRLCERDALTDQKSELAKSSWVETEVDSVGFYISFAGSFDEYLTTIDSKVKSNWRNRSKKIAALMPTPVVCRIDDPLAMPAAVDRFIAIERKSWKADAGLGVGKDERHRHFYAELTSTLAHRGEATFYFLCRGNQDIAASLIFFTKDTVYERHITHDPDYGAMSPGIVLRAEILKNLFGRQWTKFDMMGMHPSVGRQRHKADWATGRWQGQSEHFYRLRGRLFPIIVARALRARVPSTRTEIATSTSAASPPTMEDVNVR